jgi:hypothetical protein
MTGAMNKCANANANANTCVGCSVFNHCHSVDSAIDGTIEGDGSQSGRGGRGLATELHGIRIDLLSDRHAGSYAQPTLLSHSGMAKPRTTTYNHIQPRTTTYNHLQPLTTTYNHVQPRTTIPTRCSWYYIQHVTGMLVFVNTFYLLWLTAYPFTYALITSFPVLPIDQGGWVPWSTHAFITFMSSVSQYGLVLYLYFSSGLRLLPGMRQRMAWISFAYFVIAAIGCSLVSVLSFVSPTYAALGYVIVPVLFVIVRRLRNRFFPQYANELEPIVADEEEEEAAEAAIIAEAEETSINTSVRSASFRRSNIPRLRSINYDASTVMVGHDVSATQQLDQPLTTYVGVVGVVVAAAAAGSIYSP